MMRRPWRTGILEQMTILKPAPEQQTLTDRQLDLDPKGLLMALQALADWLGAEAEAQRAYLHRFSDGNVSLELEWLDLSGLARAAVTAYLDALAQKATMTTAARIPEASG